MTERKIIARVKTSNDPELIGKEGIVTAFTGKLTDRCGRSFYGDLRNIFPDYSGKTYCLERGCGHIRGDWEIIEVEQQPTDLKTIGHVMANNCKLRDENDQLKEDYKDMEIARDTLLELNDTLKAQLTGLEAEHDELVDRWSDLKEDNRELKDSNESLKEGAQDLDDRLARMVVEWKELKKQNESLNEDVEDLTVGLEEVIEERNDVMDVLQTVRDEAAQLIKDNFQYLTEKESLEELIQDQAQEIENLESLMVDDDIDDEDLLCDCPLCQFIRMLDEQGIKVI